MFKRYLLDVGRSIHENFDAVRGDEAGLLAQALHSIHQLAGSAGVNHFLAETDNEMFE